MLAGFLFGLQLFKGIVIRIWFLVTGRCNKPNLRGLYAESELDCILECSIEEECNFYTWYSLANQEISYECFMFSSCDVVDDCKEQGFIK